MKLKDFIDGFKNKDTRLLSKAITLCESQKQEHQEIVEKLKNTLVLEKYAKVIGISGLPGVGKSTFLNQIGSDLASQNKKVAILAIDPSSDVSGGSILGDKTRMQDLIAHENVFIRPTPASNYLGGVGAKTFEAIKLCELFGFDYIFVETVGVGQSESLVSEMADLFVLILAPDTGDDLQGIKRGVLEHADLLIINKADGDRLERAKNTLHQYKTSTDLIAKNKAKFKALLNSNEKNEYRKEIFKYIDNFFLEYSFSNGRQNQFEKFLQKKVKFSIGRKVDGFFKKNNLNYKEGEDFELLLRRILLEISSEV